MNILIPHSWLLEHLETEAKPEQIQEYLSLSGPSVEAIYEIEGEPVYDVEVTTNRVDSMSIRGIAREAGVILEQFGVKAKLKPLKIASLPAVKEKLPLPKVVNNDELCRRTSFVILKDVQRTATPKWMAKRLAQIEQNVHDAAIDITNYITHEIGHPIHAFDYDSIMALGGKIIVKEAEPGKSFETLDGENYKTVGGEIVFENGEGLIIDLPGVKGATNTSVNESTKNILLWIEAPEPTHIRHASMTHAIRTVAAQLNEKNVDPNLAEPTLLRGVELYRELCDAQVASKLVDHFPAKKKLSKVKVKLSRINEYLGLEISLSQIKKILKDLGCEVTTAGTGRETKLTIQPPTFRPDLTIPADIVEEIARIYGYHNLPSTLMDTPIPTTKPIDTNFQIEDRIKRYLSSVGWQEIYTYSMVGEAIAVQSGHELDDHLKLKNPLTDDKVYLRRSLLPSLVEILDYNSQREKLSVFEIANVYHPQAAGQLPQEQLELALVSNDDYRHLRGQLEALLAQFYLSTIEVVPSQKAAAGYTQSAVLKVLGKTIGYIGQVGESRYGANIVIAELLKVVKTHPEYQPIPKTMSLSEDMTFALPTGTQVGQILATIKQTDPLISQVMMTDIFKQNHTFHIEYHTPKKNLKVADIKPIRQRIADKLKTNHQAELIGQV